MSNLAPLASGSLARSERPPSQSTDARDLLRIWALVRKHWRMFLTVTAGFVAIVGIATLLTPKSYTTTVRLMTGRPASDATRANGDTALPILNALVLQNGEQSAETFAQLAQQRDLAAKVIATLNLRTTPQGLLSNLSVKPTVNTTLLNLSISWKTPEGSARIANAFADAFVDQEREFVRSEAVAALAYLSNEVPRAERRLRDTASALARFQSDHGYIDAQAHESDIVSRMSAIDQRIDQLGVDTSEAKSLLQSVQSQMAAMSSTVDNSKEVAENPISASLEQKLAEVQTQLAEAEQVYTPAHPTVISLKQQRQTLLAQIANLPSSVVSRTTLGPNPIYQSLQQQAANYQARIEGDAGDLKALQAEKKSYRPTVRALPDQVMQYATLSEEAKRAQNVYDALAQKYSDALIAKTTAISDIFVVQPASADTAIRRPSLIVNLAIALAVGLLLALGVIFILEVIEQRSDRESFEGRLGLPVIGRIPAFNTPNRRMLPWVQSMTVESFLHLCITLRLKNKRPLKTLAVVSACRGDGKSTVAYHLAKAMATLEPRVLLIDADLRRPSLHEKTDCPNTVGLGDVLTGAMPVSEAVQHASPQLDVLTAGADVANPVSLLQSHLQEVLAKVQGDYTMVIVDAPPLGAVSDGLLIATQVDGAIFVVTSNTDEKEARYAVSQLASLGIDNVLGMVVNKDTLRVNDYSDYFATSSQPLAGGTA